jgi:hypothetical protein
MICVVMSVSDSCKGWPGENCEATLIHAGCLAVVVKGSSKG